MRCGQLSMIAGAMLLPAMSASDWVANTTATFFLRSDLQPLADARREQGIVEEQPGLVEDAAASAVRRTAPPAGGTDR